MKRWSVLAAAAMLACSAGLVGCEDSSYSSYVRYHVRTDPLVVGDKLGDEAYEPDRPGVLPLLSLKDLDDPRNPLHANREKLDDSQVRDPNLLPPESKKIIESFLKAFFGTPAQPRVLGVSEETIKTLKIDGDMLAKGSSLYRIHCVHCHGVTGDGRGPTAKWVNPHPRDYRQGLFKFQSTAQEDGQTDWTPSRDDLLRVLRQGVEATAMPSFVVLPDHELEALASYVIHLSIRGTVEYRAIASGFSFDKDTGKLVAKEGSDLKELLQTSLTSDGKTGAADKWLKSQSKRINVEPNPVSKDDPEKYKASVLRGQQLFLGKGREPKEIEVAKKANCVQCHTDYGRRAKFRFDAWGTYVRPNNLTDGVYRGGRRSVDIYYRIHSGINGSRMNMFHKELSHADIWDLVNFVQVLPYPAMRKSMGIEID